MQPAKMLTAQADLVDRLLNNDMFKRFALTLTEMSLSSIDGFRRDVRERTVVTLMSLMYQSAASARCYHVSKDMTTLVQHAASLLDESDIIDFAQLAPSEYGLVLFEGGLDVMDPRGEAMKMDWLLWGDCGFVVDDGSDETTVPRGSDRITTDGFAVWEFNDRIDNPDGISQRTETMMPSRKLDASLGRWNIMGTHVMESGTPIGPALMMPEGMQLAQIIADGDTPTWATNSMRLVHAFWLLLNQPISETDVARLTGPAKKAARAAGVKRAQADKDVTVVQLRRSARQARAQAAVDPKRHIEWAGRWWVDGFWRWQAYGPGRKERKRIWVDGFVKGPADKPLIVRKHVYAVRP